MIRTAYQASPATFAVAIGGGFVMLLGYLFGGPIHEAAAAGAILALASVVDTQHRKIETLEKHIERLNLKDLGML